jgi:hypothetical protein
VTARVEKLLRSAQLGGLLQDAKLVLIGLAVGAIGAGAALLATHGSRWHVPDSALQTRQRALEARARYTDSLLARQEREYAPRVADVGQRVAAADARGAARTDSVKGHIRTLILTVPDSASRATIQRLGELHGREIEGWQARVAARDTLIGLQRFRLQQQAAGILLLRVERDSARALAGEAIEHTQRRPTLSSVLVTGTACAAAGYLAAENETAPAVGLGAVCVYRLARVVF